MIAIPGDGEMTVMGSMQCPYYIHKALKQLFNLSDETGGRHPDDDRRWASAARKNIRR